MAADAQQALDIGELESATGSLQVGLGDLEATEEGARLRTGLVRLFRDLGPASTIEHALLSTALYDLSSARVDDQLTDTSASELLATTWGSRLYEDLHIAPERGILEDLGELRQTPTLDDIGA
ncbi:hypothetical protein DOO78_26730 [Roseicella frigidaeris]|uniref:Uncharacterized protein n=1 Tax=Roseicella frigidaeris TaxID=2230885 RepID=A0A327LT52_9PROT|nr:hypothetical protein DOO78_26730 [Roseicella frigidaeris]